MEILIPHAPHSFNGYHSPCPYQHYTPSPVCTNIPDDILFDTLDSTDVLFTNDFSDFSDTTSTRNEFFTKRLRPLSKPEPDLQFDTDINTITISPSPAAKTDDLASTPSAHIDIIDDSNINLLTKCCQVLFPLLIAYRSSEHQHETSGTGRLGWFRHVKQLFTSDDFIYLNSKFHFTNSDTAYSYIASIDGVSLHYNLSDPSSLQSLLFFKNFTLTLLGFFNPILYRDKWKKKFLASLKRLKIHEFNFCKLKKAQKT